VGYCGGTKKNPTYHNLGDHSETLQVDFDPAKISYSELLRTFWDSHTATTRGWSRQYMAFVFYHSKEQKRLAEETRNLEAERLRGNILTAIVPFSPFYLAEDYHQKYYLRQEPPLVREFQDFYPSPFEFVNSTAAARVNGYVGGHGTILGLRGEIKILGLSPESAKRLFAIVNWLNRF
jgi:peptide-methionine (S)-S-oxide reductase